MSRTYPSFLLQLLYSMHEVGDQVDLDQVLHWMAWIGETIGDLDPAERAELALTARDLADEAENSGDLDRADAYRQMAGAEDAP